MKSLSVGILLFLPMLLVGQQDGLRYSSPISSLDFLSKAYQDTYTLHEFQYRIQEELGKKGYLNLALISAWSQEAIAICEANHFQKALPDIYTQLGNAFLFKNKVDQARQFYQEAVALGSENNDLQSEAKARLALGYSFIYGNFYQTAVQECLHALALAHLAADKTLQIDIYDHLVGIFYLSRDFVSAYKSSIQLKDLADEIHDENKQLRGYSLLSDLHGEMGLYDKQREMVDFCLSRKTYVRDSATLYSIYNMAYEACMNQGQYDEALQFAIQLVPLGILLHNEHVVDAKLGKVYMKLGKLEEAKQYYERSLEANRANDIYIDTYKYLDLGKITFALGKEKEALVYYHLAEEDIEKPLLPIQRDINGGLYEFYNHTGDKAKAFAYLKKYNSLADSVQRFQNTMRYGVHVLEYEAIVSQAKMDLLSRDNTFNRAMAVKLRQKRNVAYTGTFFILVITGFAFYRYKKYRELQHRSAMTSERLRISRDLHDEVGAALSGISMYSHVAQGQVASQNSAAVQKSLTIMQQSAGEMIDRLNDIVWLINPEQDTIVELFDKLEEYALQMTRAKNMEVEVIVPDRFAELHIPLEARRSIYLFCKEAINNAAKYSEGTHIILQVKEDKQGMRFSVSDDGKGFDEITIRKGNGLKNMRQRAEEIGAMAEFAFSKGKGTKVEMFYKIMQ